MTRRALSKPDAFIPGPPSKSKRNRTWEREHPDVVSYRGVPKELARQIKEIADRLDVPVGELARAFLEHGLSSYNTGALELSPRLKTGKFSLFSDD